MATVTRSAQRFIQAEWHRRYGSIPLNDFPLRAETVRILARLGRPRQIGETISPCEMRESFDAMAEATEFVHLVRLEHEARRMAAAAEHLQRQTARRVLEAGCGTGLMLAFLAQEFPQTDFLGSDISPRSIALAKQRIERLRLKNACVVVCPHVEIAACVGPNIDTVVVKDSFYGGELLPRSSTFTPLEWDRIFASDRVIASRREMHAALVSRLRRGGCYLLIQPLGEEDGAITCQVLVQLGLKEDASVRRVIPGGIAPRITDFLLFRKAA